ncbi:MAG: L-2-hydroxyglutarate oxidase [Chloroflexota bacterium]|nr:MAG: L-2-hydroxyglutarate oxidase [Chloroflexota bacterium]
MGAPPAVSDVVVIGAGIVGLATALRLLERLPDLRVTVVEKEHEVAVHQSGHNSGVVHAGIYYPAGSLKAQLCRDGKALLERFAARYDVPISTCGKLIVALDEGQLPALEGLQARAIANAVPGVEVVGPERIRDIEPHVHGVRALWSPTTAIIDFRRVAIAFAEEVRRRGGSIALDARVTAIRTNRGRPFVVTTAGDLEASVVIACAGLQSDRVARLTGRGDPDVPEIVPFRGDYYTLVPSARHLVRGLIYPVPDSRFPFLGVHFTRRIDGEVWAGPNAVLAFAREGYRRRDINLRDLATVLAYPGFLRLARRFLGTGLAEMWRDISKPAFVAELRRLVPELTSDDVVFGPSGVRAQALNRDGTLVDDFVLDHGDRILHVRNAPSPAATSSLAIGGRLAETAIERFGLA